MSAEFYNAFDHECLVDAFNRKRKVGTDYRGVFHQDRDRIMFTPAFRRLQAKTQVFQAGEYDFYRTRLTHSLEVSRIAESLTIWLRRQYPEIAPDFQLIEAICISHDLGHPPFGHAGERILNTVMEDYGGFEGNAQSLRLLTRTIYSSGAERFGMTPSRALVDGILKYKRLYADRGDDTHHFIYDEQAELLEFCFGTHAIPSPNDFKSLECQIMDFADDIAYSSFDVIDGWKARFLTPDKLEDWGAGQELDATQRAHLDVVRTLMRQGKLLPSMNGFIGEFIQAISLEKRDTFLSAKTRRYDHKLILQPEARVKIKLQKRLCSELIYGSSALRQIEFKGEQLLGTMARTLLKNYLDPKGKPSPLVPDDTHKAIVKAPDAPTKARLICDHLAGMTDAYALRSYKRLFDPDYGSISELI